MESDKKRAGRKLKSANQAEILRSTQRDNDFVSNLSEKISDLLTRFKGYRSLLHFMQSDIPARFVYFVLTSGMGNQTLGEEYTGIVQADLDARKVPSLSARILAAILECFGEQAFLRILLRLQASINHPHSELTPAAVAFFNSLLSKLRAAVPLLILAHRGLFYIFGRYYSLGKRIAGVDYAKIYGKRPTDGISWGLRLLGVATLVQFLLRLFQKDHRLEENSDFNEIELSTSTKCQLCLEKLPTTATPCGHLFCWNCLAEWLRTRARCPLCREHVLPSRIVHLMNI
ncbi:peroxisome biogenesis factor 10-like [Belonocnema kinseyi]|uniref:peroxisome biogenesis factor 10-like n=1 Tax=Belonocnema kinseyi TaxID=2817044 RepID=UPI00143D28E4|nr:peroxisome biogenesis factor 10-like [Belonocnema kinseyi]